MVNVRKRGKVYEYSFDVAKIEGKRKRVSKSGFKTKAEALKQGTIAYNEYLNTGRNIKTNEMSYSDFLDYWLNNHCKINLKYHTIAAYSYIVKNHLQPNLGFYKLYQITKTTLQDFLNKVYVEKGLCALTWEDVDFENKVINVRHSVFDKKKNENGRWYIGTTKTKNGERQIHISPTLMKALVNFRNKQMELMKLYRKEYHYYHFEEVKNQYGKVLEYQIVENRFNILSMKPANMIFTRDNGKYCGTDIIKYPYKIIHDELSIEKCRYYDLRGSYATTILRNGVEIRDVADVLGHKDIETTENYYISSTDESRKNVTDSYDDSINLDVIDEIIEYKISI